MFWQRSPKKTHFQKLKHPQIVGVTILLGLDDISFKNFTNLTQSSTSDGDRLLILYGWLFSLLLYIGQIKNSKTFKMKWNEINVTKLLNNYFFNFLMYSVYIFLISFQNKIKV